MAITYTWKLIGLKKSNPASLNVNDVVIGTRWTVTGEDEDGNTGVFTGATPLSIDSVDPDNFTSYEDLTEELVLGWVQEIVSGSQPTNYWAHISERIEEQIAEKAELISNVEGADLPWSPEPDPIVEPLIPSGSGE